jgi:hypothetical protein
MFGFKQFLKQMLQEGGNIKVKTPHGEIAAAPFDVKNRQEQAADVHNALHEIHNSFHAETGHHLFGKDAKSLHARSAFAGSTKHFMDTPGVSDAEFKKHKPTVGDVDAQIPAEHKAALEKHLTPGKRFGKYTVVGTKKHGNEVSAVMRHDNGEHHQFDFEGVHYHNHEPTTGEQFLHSADWEDTKAGIKGAHHKILLNAAGLHRHKFSITHGVRSRTDETDTGATEPEDVKKKLFGTKAKGDVESFRGVTQLIKHYLPASEHQAIYDKFKAGLAPLRGADNSHALAHLRHHLGVKDTVTESIESAPQHTSVVPLAGVSPFSHMGHFADLGSALNKLPGTKHVGVSSKAEAFSPEERKGILDRQWGKGQNSVHIVKSAGETIRAAHDSLNGSGKKVLHILVGHDRKAFADGLKKSLEAGKIKEMEGRHFDEIHIHYPEDTDRSHGMSGTKMRTAAHEGDEEEFHKHLGPMFSRLESNRLMKKVHDKIASGEIPLKR